MIGKNKKQKLSFVALFLVVASVLSISVASVTSGISYVVASPAAEPEPEPETETEEEPQQEETETEPEPEPQTGPKPETGEEPVVEEPELFRCPDNTLVEDEDSCPPTVAASTEAEPEPTPIECPPGQFYVPGDPGGCVDCEGPCPEEPPPTEEEGPDQDCLFNPSLPKCASDNGVCPDGFFQNEDGNCVPDHPNGCPEGYHSHEDDETGQCIPDDVPCQPGYTRDPDFPTCSSIESVCRDHPEEEVCNTDDEDDDDNDDDDNDNDVTVVVNKIIRETNNNNNDGSGHHHESFPEIDIIGLSAKENGDSMVCLINIDDENVQCQEFGMEDSKVNRDLWRVIETDHDKDYDNGNTGSDDIDDVIEDIKNQDFSELDDASNHDFGIDLAWIAINPQGDGFVCLTEDSSGKGKSLCEPFKVSAEDVDGQITEGVQIES